MSEYCVGVLGGRSLVGGSLLSLLRGAGLPVVAFSRQAVESGSGVEWRRLSVDAASSCGAGERLLPYWICVAPIWVLPNYFELMEQCGVRRVVALSSTSRFSKAGSRDMEEQAMAARLREGEARLQEWATQRGVEWVILRPTLIYGYGRDKNITEIAGFIRRFGFFPLFGGANGMRQPVHADDVAAACVGALQAEGVVKGAYNISGGESLTYRALVARVFEALGRPQHVLSVPLWAFRMAVSVVRVLPRYRHWSAAMAERMNQDLCFDHSDAVRDFGFHPAGFELKSEDLGG